MTQNSASTVHLETTGNISTSDLLIDTLDERLHNLHNLVSSSDNNRETKNKHRSFAATNSSSAAPQTATPAALLLAQLQPSIAVQASGDGKKVGNTRLNNSHIAIEPYNKNNNNKSDDRHVVANLNSFSSISASNDDDYHNGDDDLPQSLMLRDSASDDEDTDDQEDYYNVRSRTKRAATAKRDRLWDFGVIPYVIGENTTHERRAVYVAAMRHWMNLTCITFVERREPKQQQQQSVAAAERRISGGNEQPQHDNYIFFTERPCGCCSFVGRRGNGGQAISIGKNCDKFGIVVHELGHVVGFWHEHTRPDRDKHVDIVYKNVMSGQEYNFAKLNESEVDSLGQAYDYASIMHYARNTFSKSTFLDTLVPRVFLPGSTSERPEIGQRLHLSPGDIAQTKLLYKCPRCGRTLLEPYDTFHSPQYDTFNSVDIITAVGKQVREEGKDEKYSDKSFSSSSSNDEQYCIWKIFATPGEIISLNITDLDIHDDSSMKDFSLVTTSGNCKYSYLEIRDGYWHLSPLLARFCGSKNSLSSSALALRSSGPFLYVEYRQRSVAPSDRGGVTSQQSQNSRGFYAHYEFVCGGNISAPHGTLQSPNFPDLYRPDKECVWIITVKAGYQVALRFQSFEVENHDQCIYDRLELRDGPSSASPLITRLCGYERPDVVLKSAGNVMYVKFVSDGSVQKSGFSAEYVTEFDECAPSNQHASGCEHKCVNTFGGYRCECQIGYELHSDGKHCEEACGGYIDLTNSNGTLASPSFPNLYPASKKCIWQISAPENYRVILNFTHFDMEGNNEDCEYDYVLISSAATAHNHNISVGSTHGMIDEQDDTNNGGNGGIADGGRAWKSHGAFCGQSLPPTITSESNVIRITFNSDASVQKTGFGLIYSSDFDECSINNGNCQQICTNTIGSHRCSCESGYDLHVDLRSCKEGGCTYDTHAPSGEVKSPAYPEPYPSRKDCTWAFSTLPGHRIGLNFYKFEIEPHQECLYDYIEIFDGPSAAPGTSMLGRFCGTQSPPPITSSTNQMFMTFKSDASVQRDGFLGVHRTVCGGHYYTADDDGENSYIYSHASYGDTNYGNNEDCDWLIEVSPSTPFENENEADESEDEQLHQQRRRESEQVFVYIEFDAFEIEDDPECTYDFVDIYDGYSAKTAPKIGRFCSNVLPPSPIISNGRALLVKFKSDASINAKGFKFRYGLMSGDDGRSDNFDSGGRSTSIAPYSRQHYYSRWSSTAAPPRRRYPDGWIDDNNQLDQQTTFHPNKRLLSPSTVEHELFTSSPLTSRHQPPSSRSTNIAPYDDVFDANNIAVESPPPEEYTHSISTPLNTKSRHGLHEHQRNERITFSFSPAPFIHNVTTSTPPPQLLRNFRHHDLRRHGDERSLQSYENTWHNAPAHLNPFLFEENRAIYSSWSGHDHHASTTSSSTTTTTESSRQRNYEQTLQSLRQRYSQNYNQQNHRVTVKPTVAESSQNVPVRSRGGRTEPTRFWYTTTARGNDESLRSVSTTSTSSPFWWHSARQPSRYESSPSSTSPASTVARTTTPMPATRSAPAPTVIPDSAGNLINRKLTTRGRNITMNSRSRSGSKFPITGKYYASPPQEMRQR